MTFETQHHRDSDGVSIPGSCNGTPFTVTPTESEDILEKVNMHYHNFFHNSYDALNSMRKAGELCDVEIKVDDRSLWGHRVVLASSSSYFRAMFLSNLIESHQKRIHITGITYQVMSDLIDFCYTGHLYLSFANVSTVLEAADRLQILDAKDICCSYLSRVLQSHNCLGILKLATTYDCIDLAGKASNICYKEFVNVSQCEEFLETHINDLKDLLSKDCLHMASEQDAYVAVTNWINTDLDNRKIYVQDLIPLIRWTYIEEYYVRSCISKDRLLSSIITPLINGNNLQPPRMYTEYLVVIGGMRASSSLRCYNIYRQKWMLLPRMSVNRRREENTSVVAVNNKIYCIGSVNASYSDGGCECYNIRKNCWKAIASPNTDQRFMFSCVSVNGIIYALGGYDTYSQIVHCAVESYNPEENIWKYGSQMLERRYAFTANVINDTIYVIGGYNTTECLSSCEHYDINSQQWRHIANMPQARARHVAGVVFGLLYVISGVTSFRGEYENSVLAYDPTNDSWKHKAALPFIPSHPQLVIFHEHLYLIGHDENILQYNPRVDKWTVICWPKMKRYYGSIVIHTSNISPIVSEEIDCPL